MLGGVAGWGDDRCRWWCCWYGIIDVEDVMGSEVLEDICSSDELEGRQRRTSKECLGVEDRLGLEGELVTCG